ncbi:hypothetical protein GOODEAATRI_000860 [Goodea atripinnis]|uniref:Uncharacterized protein n=1 Tax=Goodea atripinnis TaxID=208336 RepID=A0ABV0NRX0_9TELE
MPDMFIRSFKQAIFEPVLYKLFIRGNRTKTPFNNSLISEGRFSSYCLRVVFLPDGQQFVQQIGSSSQQSASGHIQSLPPPRVRAQRRHHPAVVLQRLGDHVAVKRELLIEAPVPAEINHTRPRPGEAEAPVHALCPPPLSASFWQVGSASAGASWVPTEAGAKQRKEPGGHKHPVLGLSSSCRGGHSLKTTRAL